MLVSPCNRTWDLFPLCQCSNSLDFLLSMYLYCVCGANRNTFTLKSIQKKYYVCIAPKELKGWIILDVILTFEERMFKTTFDFVVVVFLSQNK